MTFRRCTAIAAARVSQREAGAKTADWQPRAEKA